MRLALDTSRYSDLCRGDEGVVSTLENAESVYLPFAVLAELRAGFAVGRHGVRNERVLRQFLMESVLLSFLGGVGGLAIAALLTALLALLLPGFVPVLPLWAVSFGIGSSCLTGVLAGYLPARRAARLDPVEALRHEAA